MYIPKAVKSEFVNFLGDAEPFAFARVRGEKTWMHGPEQVQFTDLPNGGMFRWSHVALVVAE